MISEHDRQVLNRLPVWNPAGDIAAQRRAWEELAVVYNHDLPAIGGLEENVELRPALCADVAVPKGAGPHPVVIYLHGGGWAFGSPASFRKLGMQFAEAGYLTIILDYRLAPSIRSRRHSKTRSSRSDGRLTRAPMERRWPADRDWRRFRGRQSGGQRPYLQRS